MPTITVYSRGNAPIREFRNLSEENTAKLVERLTDSDIVSTSIETYSSTQTRTPTIVHFIHKHITQIEVT